MSLDMVGFKCYFIDLTEILWQNLYLKNVNDMHVKEGFY